MVRFVSPPGLGSLMASWPPYSRIAGELNFEESRVTHSEQRGAKKRHLIMLWKGILCQHIFIGDGALISTFWIRVLFSGSSNNFVQVLDQLVELFRRKRFD